ncbi:MAG: AAA family ATPase, partial [Anaerolineales bacterium]
MTRFFGRESEIVQIREHLDENRLVTLTGPGGVGKSRLSLHAVEELMPGFSDGVWLVELAPLTDAALVPQDVAVTLGVRDEPERPVLETLIAHLRERQLILILDNCEHLLEACARLAEVLLRTCSRVRLLATSREPLGIQGEAVFAIPSLPFPEPEQTLAPETLIEYASVRLLIDRARLVLPDYTLTSHNADAVARICQRLNGIPLAIEMAAARLRHLDAATLAARLDDAFGLLTGGSRTALLRQQTLRATIDWSYALLNEEERLLLQRLSVFAGGCTLEAAEAVCGGEGMPTGRVLGALTGLVDKSMVLVVLKPGEETRYRLLEMVRQYAREKLEATEDGVRLHTRHRDYYLALAETTVPRPNIRACLNWAKKLESMSENLRQALAWSLSEDGLLSNVEAGPRLAIAMFADFESNSFWSAYNEKIEWYNRCLALCKGRSDVSAQLYARLLVGAAHTLIINDPQTSLIWAQQAVEISRGLGPGGRQTL